MSFCTALGKYHLGDVSQVREFQKRVAWSGLSCGPSFVLKDKCAVGGSVKCRGESTSFELRGCGFSRGQVT